MNIDSFTKTGHSHTLFEDSVITGDSPFPYLIVSDGCSSSKNTHLGSHLLSRSAELELLESENIHASFGESIIYRARSMADLMGLSHNALDATLLVAYVKDDKVHVWMTGDGCLYYKSNGVKTTLSIQYFRNMPYYLSYKLEPLRNESYRQKVEEAKENNESIKTVMRWQDDILTEVECDYNKALKLILNKDDLEYLVLSTDGIESFVTEQDRTLNEIDLKIHSFKKFTGDFLQRRIKRIIKEEAKEGRNHFDDIGIAAISFNKEGE